MQANETMSVWGLVADASLVVQGVMVVLVLASLASWYLIIQRSLVLRRAEQDAASFHQQFRLSTDLARLHRETAQSAAAGAALQQLFVLGFERFSQLRRQPECTPDVVLDGVSRQLQVTVAEQDAQLERGLPFLATVGSVSPYIGLFGTVWGIMNSFLGLSMVQQATLSTVAPGIAEALIATAIGLFAAIPAVMAYNRLSARVQVLSAGYYGFANEMGARLHTRLHSTPAAVAAAA